MYRNLAPAPLGISGRQSEMIELALTYKFRGLEIDVEDFLKQAEQTGVAQAAQFLTSAKLKLGGAELPTRWQGELALYKADLAGLSDVAKSLKAAGTDCCYTWVLPESDSLPFHENFEQSRQRLSEVADVLAAEEIQLAIGFYAAHSRQQGLPYPFVSETESLVTLLKSVASDNAGLLFDTWDWQVGGGTLELLQSLGAERVAYVRLADPPAEFDRAELTEEQRLLPATEGGFATEALTLLKEAGYRGSVAIAPHASSFAGQGSEAIVQKCSELLTELWQAAGVGKRLVPAANTP